VKTCTRCLEAKPLDRFHKGHAQCKPCRAAKQAAYYQANRDKVLTGNRERAKTYQPPASVIEYRKKYREEHREVYRESGRRTRARRAGVPVSVIPVSLIGAKVAYWGRKCWVCKAENPSEMDHVKPVSKGGAHILANLRPICGSCNRSKRDRWPLTASG
jgi:5-methylcytosine-specific restriction endonuclease McrA